MAKHYIMTPFATVIAAYLERPDKPYEEGGKPKYKVRLDVTDAQVKEFQAAIVKLIGPQPYKVKNPKIGISKSQETALVTLLASSDFKPAVFDMKNNKLEKARIGKGTVLRAYCQLNIHDKGVGLQLIQVQVKELKEWEGSGGGEGKSAFETGEGYAADPEAFGGGEDAADESSAAGDVDALGI